MSQAPTNQTAKVSSKKPVFLLVMLLICGILAITYYVCRTQYTLAKQEIYENQDKLLQLRAHGIAKAVDLWISDIEAQAQRVSSSDLYSLFTAEVQDLDAQSLSSLSQTDPNADFNPDDDISLIVAQIPLIRDTLLDYMNYSGLQDARIINSSGLTLLSALTRPTPLNKTQLFAVDKAIEINNIAFSPARSSVGGLVMDFADPITPLAAAGLADSKPQAALLLTTSIAGNVAQFLTYEQDFNATIQARLVQKNANSWEEITLNNILPFTLLSHLKGQDGIIPFQEAKSADGNEHVYFVAKWCEKIEWWVIAQIPASLIADEMQSAAWTIYGIGLLISLGFILLLALLWWVMVGREQKSIADKFRDLYALIKQQKSLLDCVNASLDVGIFMTDTQGIIQVCNKAFADIMRNEEESLLHVQLANLFDVDMVAPLLQAIRDVQDSGKSTSLELSLHFDEEEVLVRATLFPMLDESHELAEGSEAGSIVGIMQDITEFRRRSKRHQKQQQNTIKALVQAIEGVDPYLAGHSQLMEKIANFMVAELELDEKDANTLRISAGLSQVGKLFVPRELLTKTEGLTDEEHALMMKIPEHAYKVLKNIDFGLPVAEAVYAMFEKMDGSGYPLGLKGSAISIHARVLAVLNAFCAMISPRSYRSGMDPKAVVSILQKDPSCDQDVVAALDRALCTQEVRELLQDRAEETAQTIPNIQES